MESSISLEDRLADALPEKVKTRVYHISTPPTASPPIFSAAPGQEDQPTLCESHFLGVSSPQEGNEGEVFVFAIEVLIFTTDSLTTVFVSKADSSGFVSRLHPRTGSPSIPQTITRAFLDYLLRPRLDDQRLVLSLFARSQNQYLFPGSIENAEKHVLDDRQLIKWWCRVLDSVWRPYDNQPTFASRHESYTVSAHVVVPGCDKGETRAFFPSSLSKASSSTQWLNSYPMGELSLDTSLPLRCLIPRFPDDPKSRFLGDLDGNHIGPNGEWRSVKNMEQFWEMMSYRQECSAGRLVGFVWIVFSRAALENETREQDQQASTSFRSDVSELGPLPTPANSQRPTFEQAQAGGPTNDDLRPIEDPASPPPSSPIMEPQDTTEAPSVEPDGVSNGTIAAQPAVELTSNPGTIDGPILTSLVAKSGKTPGQVIIPSTDYEILIDTLVDDLDFAGSEMASQSTQKWLAQVAIQAGSGVPSFGVSVVGKKSQNAPRNGTPNTTGQVNLLTGVKKKRKADQSDVAPSPPVPDSASPQVLSANLIRKKPKVSNAE